jgi:hypothetical protein
MSAKNLDDLLHSLPGSSFVKADGDRYRYESDDGSRGDRNDLPWQIQHWDIDAGHQGVSTVSFVTRLNGEYFLENLQDNLKERFPSFRKASLESDRKGGYWLLVEFLDGALDSDQSRLIEGADSASSSLPHGLAGLQLSVIHAIGQVSIFMTRHCFLGNTPGAFFVELPKILNASLFGTKLMDKTNFNSYLLTLKSEELKAALIQRTAIEDHLAFLLSEAGSPSGQIKLSFEGKNWKLAWMPGEETPELLVPPMEILEQKEVARKFQRLDELILLEDFQGALEQCREYLVKNPQSLYLVRRWAFLTLWAGVDFDKQYLDLMVKFDPHNLMTLSLHVRYSLSAGLQESLLENLSRLGASLGQSIVDFDSLDITSLTLPEMLGDAWNHRDDQRAVNCYERVLDARGEIPRILVKLIRLMRDIDDSPSEESYMDRLLACEVPTRTRAAIYYRLAEIKQAADPALACDWALKSWHTYKIQVRYAMLAADLLIQLERPHDAVHVLVETSELLEGETVDERLFLELKIAGIWFNPMRRLDLAIERVGRALELVGQDLKTFDEMVRLVEAFEDIGLLLDVTSRAIEVARKQDDKDRQAAYSRILLTLLDGLTHSDQARVIYNAILNATLLPVEDLQRVVQRLDFDWPFQQIELALKHHIDRLDIRDQAPYLLLFGDVASDRLEDPDRIFEYYEKATSSGAMNTRSFDFLDAYYSRKGMNSERFALLQKKLLQAQGSERAVLLRELYYFDEGVADSDKDRYALLILGEDADDAGPLEERLQHYEDLANGDAIVSMMMGLNSLGLDGTVVCSLLKAGLQSLQSLGAGSRQSQLLQLLDQLKEAGENDLEWGHLTVHYLWHADDKTQVRQALGMLIEQRVTPAKPLAEVLDVLTDNRLKVFLLLQLAETSSDFEEILAHERSALRYAREDPALSEEKLEIQERLVIKVEFTVGELEEFFRELNVLGRSGEAIAHLFTQLRLSTHQDHRSFVMQQLIEALKALESAHSPAAREMLANIAAQSIETSARLRLAWLERFGVDMDLHGVDFVDHLLQEKALWSSRGLILALIEHYLGANDLRPMILERINGFLSRLMQGQHHDEFRYFIDEPAIGNAIDDPTLRSAIDTMLQLRDAAGLEQFWRIALQRLTSPSEAEQFLKASLRQFSELNLKGMLYGFLRQILESSKEDIPTSIHYEIKLFYASNLREWELSLDQARNVLESLHNERPEDARIWASLIFVYREASADDQLYDLLTRVIEPLRADPSSLDEYNISIEGLALEFSELKARRASVPSKSYHEVTGVGRDSLSATATVLTSQRFVTDQPTLIDLDSPMAGFSLNDETGLSPSLAFGSEDPTRTDTDPSEAESAADSVSYGFDSEREVKPDADAFGLKAPPDPMHTSVAVLPQRSSLGFHLEDTQSSDLPTGLPIESISPYESTNAYYPKPESLSPLPPPPVQPSPQEFSSMAGTPALPMQVLPVDLSYTGIRSDLSAAWKQVAKTATADSGLLRDLLARPLAEPTEQVIAVQVAALVGDQIPALSAFPNRIWRDPSSVRFEMKWTGRMTRDQFHPGIKSPLARLLKSLYPLFIQAFRLEMGLSGVADRLKMRAEDVMKIRKPIDFQDEVIQRSNLRFYVQTFQDAGYNLFHLPSIGDRFQFDFEKRDIYIDRNHYMVAPSSHIFHRLTFLLRAVNLDYFPFLHLSSSGEIYPFLMKCRRSFDQGDGMKRVLGLEKDPIRQLLTQAKDREHLIALFSEVGNFSVDRISQAVSYFIEQIYRLNLAESLDLIGAIETISGIDLMNPRASSFQRINQSSSAKSILAFAAELKFG